MKKIPHPSGATILFDAKWHQYKLQGVALRSVSKLLDKYFPFDEKGILALVSRKTGEPPALIKQKWSRQALLGKNVHEYIECKLLQRPPPALMALVQKQREAATAQLSASSPPTPPIVSDLLHGEEHLYIPVADAAVEKILTAYDVVGVEQVVACPEWGIAGTIDFVGRHKETGRILIGDWKTSGSVTSEFRFGSFESPCTGCLHHLPNNKVYRYALQTMVYGEILRKERYFEKGFFDKALLPLLTSNPEPAVADPEDVDVSGDAKKKKKSASMKDAKGKQQLVKASPGGPQHSIDWYHADMQNKLDYGIVQLSKNEEGEVTVEFKGVSASTVLPKDGIEMNFHTLLTNVMEGN